MTIHEPVAGQDRVDFLRRRREELLEGARQTQAPIEVLDGKIAHYSAEVSIT
jgi:hypothetical protein